MIDEQKYEDIPGQLDINEEEIKAILEEHLSVTDEWGGCKLAGWQYGHAVLVAGIEDAASAIFSRVAEKDREIERWKARAERWEKVCIEAAILLEALKVGTTWELAPEIRTNIGRVVNEIHAALEDER